MTIVQASHRHVDCEAAFNIRDLGGYVASGGRTVRWKTLYRADALHRVPGAAVVAGTQLGWRTVLDLRTAPEVEAGAFQCDGVEVLHLPVLRDVWEVVEETAEAGVVAFLTARYLEMLHEGAAAFCGAVEAVASADRLPAVFHCSAGKDRTGVLAALLLSTLGVSDDDIAADYHLSARAIEALRVWIERHRPELVEQMSQQPATFLACPPEAILGFLDGVRREFGTCEGYLREAGVDPDALTRLPELLLEDPSRGG